MNQTWKEALKTKWAKKILRDNIESVLFMFRNLLWFIGELLKWQVRQVIAECCNWISENTIVLFGSETDKICKTQ